MSWSGKIKDPEFFPVVLTEAKRDDPFFSIVLPVRSYSGFYFCYLQQFFVLV
jgi:hypothetical protein